MLWIVTIIAHILYLYQSQIWIPALYRKYIAQYVKTVLYFFSAIDWYIANKYDVFTMYIRTKCGPVHYIENI